MARLVRAMNLCRKSACRLASLADTHGCGQRPTQGWRSAAGVRTLGPEQDEVAQTQDKTPTTRRSDTGQEDKPKPRHEVLYGLFVASGPSLVDGLMPE